MNHLQINDPAQSPKITFQIERRRTNAPKLTPQKHRPNTNDPKSTQPHYHISKPQINEPQINYVKLISQHLHNKTDNHQTNIFKFNAFRL